MRVLKAFTRKPITIKLITRNRRVPRLMVRLGGRIEDVKSVSPKGFNLFDCIVVISSEGRDGNCSIRGRRYGSRDNGGVD